MILRTLQGWSSLDYRIDIDKARETIDYINQDSKYPENGGRDRFWEFVKMNFIDNPYASIKKLFWEQILKWETEDIGTFYNHFKGDIEMKKIMDTDFDILKIANRLWNIKPNCKKEAKKDYGCRGWYLEALKNFLRPFIDYMPKLEQLDRYLMQKFNVKLEDLDDETAKRIIKNFLFRNMIPTSLPTQTIPIQPTPVQPIQPMPVQPTQPTFTRPSEENPLEQKEFEQIEIKPEIKKASFDINKLLPFVLGAIAVYFITKR